MKYQILLNQNQEGKYVAIVPALPGCVGQGETEDEALANISQEIAALLSKTKVVQMRGWLAAIHRAKEGTPTLVSAYQRLQKTVDYYCDFTILPFDDAAAEQLAELRRQKIRISTQDLRIAAIALSVGGILVTCNTRDFSRVLDLTIDDWSQG